MIGKTNASIIGDKLSPIDAYIAVTYPEGSECTCTNGTKTLALKKFSNTVISSLNWV